MSIRLYRALRGEETSLKSNLINNNKLEPDLNFLNEAYSHIVPTYKLRENSQYRTVFSFTDDFRIAKKLLKAHSDIYTKIGYIDVEITDCFTTNVSGLFLIIPVFRLSDWVELMAYSKSQDITNLNYNCNSIRLINTVVPSRWSVRSLANINREYIIICDNLSLHIIEDVEHYPIDSLPKAPKMNLLGNGYDDYKENIKIVNQLQDELKDVKISDRRRRILETELKKLRYYYLGCYYLRYYYMKLTTK